ncbi:MAG: helix-turn-helix domain-containing protein [Fimbriiglobus sp.]
MRSWRQFFQASSTAVFVVGAARRLRYANPAWEKLTGESWAKLRGLKLSAYRSATELGQTLMPPPEAWAGRAVQVRRAFPGKPSGPPWWDIAYIPLWGDGKLLGIVGSITQVGELGPRRAVGKVPENLAELQLKQAQHFHLDLVSGTSVVGERFLNLVRVAALTTSPVWLLGERGAGKATTGRVLHHNGLTREKTLLTIDGHGVQPYLLEAMLFGKGGVSQAPSLGTVLLRDPAALPREFQQKLLPWLAKPNGPRVICTSAADPTQDERLIDGFATLFGSFTVRVPSVRERLEDWPWFAERVRNHPYGSDVGGLIMAYDWPGNWREFAATWKAAVERAGSSPVQASHFPRTLRERHLLARNPLPIAPRQMGLEETLTTIERRIIEAALAEQTGNVTAAAKQLKVSRASLLRRIASLKIAVPGEPT